MKKLLLIALLTCTICTCNTAYASITDRVSEPMKKQEYTLVHADSTRILQIGGLSLSVMDFAQTTVTLVNYADRFHDCYGDIVKFGPSPRMRLFNFPPHSRQKLVITDDDYYRNDGIRIYKLDGFLPDWDYPDLSQKRLLFSIASDVKFDFDLSEYDCDWDIYIVFLNTERIHDNAFRNFKLSDNIKSINLYFGGEVIGIDRKAFTSIPRFDVVDITKLFGVFAPASPHDFFDTPTYDFHPSLATYLYEDSFTTETYNNTPLLSTITQEEFDYYNSFGPCEHSWYNYFKNHPLGVENIAVDKNTVDYTIQDRTIVLTNLTPSQLVEVYTLSGANVGRYTADDAGSLSIDIAQSGFYLLNANNTCLKVAIR